MIDASPFPLLIIGGGPAGYTAAIYASRAGLSPVLYQGPQPGGQLMLTTDVENFPGYPKGIMGPQMMEEFKEQAIRFGASIRSGMITHIDFNTYPYQVTIDHTQVLTTKSIIIATGASAKWLGLDAEKRLNGRGVSACAICDGFFFKGKHVAIVGGGDTAAEEALYLAKMCPKVYMVVRKNKMRASKIMQKRIHKHENIEVLWERETVDILGKERVEAMVIYNKTTQKNETIPIHGFFIAIGHTPNTSCFIDGLDHTPDGYLITRPGSTHTSKKGVFAAGDVQDKVYRQAVTAAGSGCMAALDAERYLVALGDEE